MHSITVDASTRFRKNFKSLPKVIKDKTIEKELVFRADPFDARLKTHKLHGKQSGEWAFSVDHKYRVKFVFIEDRAVLFLDIGAHDELYS